MQEARSFPPGGDVEAIYQQLKRGMGHEHVNDDNVFTLINMAVRYGDEHIEQLLREWQAPCDPEPDNTPGLSPPTPGFNRQHTKR